MKYLILAIVAYFIYRAWQETSSDGVANDETLTEPIINSILMQQPQQKYYVKPSEDPRVDGADQPWFNGDRSFLGMTGSDLLSFGEGMGVSNYNTKSFWSELGSRYSH